MNLFWKAFWFFTAATVLIVDFGALPIALGAKWYFDSMQLFEIALPLAALITIGAPLPALLTVYIINEEDTDAGVREAKFQGLIESCWWGMRYLNFVGLACLCFRWILRHSPWLCLMVIIAFPFLTDEGDEEQENN